EWLSLTREAMERFNRTGKIGPYEKEYVRKDGTRWWGLFTGTKLGEGFGVEYVLDISDRKQAGEALRQSEERFRQFAENSADVFWIVDAERQKLEYLNPVYEKVWGEPRDETMRDINHWLESIYPEDRERMKAEMP